MAIELERVCFQRLIKFGIRLGPSTYLLRLTIVHRSGWEHNVDILFRCQPFQGVASSRSTWLCQRRNVVLLVMRHQLSFSYVLHIFLVLPSNPYGYPHIKSLRVIVAVKNSTECTSNGHGNL
jgi:hypothetical protein